MNSNDTATDTGGTQEFLEFEDFLKVKMATGTILDTKPNTKACAPAFVMRIDFGGYGIRTTSAQLTENYRAEELVGKQVVAVMNFPVKRIAGVKSEVLVLGAVSDTHGVVLLEPSFPVENGAEIG